MGVELIEGALYKVEVKDWKKVHVLNLGECDNTKPRESWPRNVTMALIAVGCDIDEVSVYNTDNKYNHSQLGKIEAIQFTKKPRDSDRKIMFYQNENIYIEIPGDSQTTRVVNMISSPNSLIIDHNKLNDNGLAAFYSYLKSNSKKSTRFDFLHIPKNKTDSVSLKEKLFLTILPFRDAIGDGKFHIINENGKINYDTLLQDMFKYLNVDTFSYKQKILVEKELVDMFPVNDWKLIKESKVTYPAIGIECGDTVCLESNILKLTIKIPLWNLVAILSEGALIKGKLYGFYVVLKEKNNVFLAPMNTPGLSKMPLELEEKF